MKHLLYAFLIVTISILLTGCDTENNRLNGNKTIHLNPGEKLVSVTMWRTAPWYLTRPMNANDKAETYKFQEDKAYGTRTFIIIEHEK